ncbi:MAG: hypothetical protein IJJ47_14280 [Methanosphaera sp.]|nr:hypothetical protein [Methanosphaera sp.]
MKKNKQVLLFTALIILLIGVTSATEVSKDITDTNSISKEVVKQDTHKVSDTTNIIQKKKVSNKKLDDKRSKINKTTKKANIKEDSDITNWQQLKEAAQNANSKTKDTTITLGNGTYKTSGSISFNNTNTVITINGNGQTIDGNKQQVFIIRKGASVVLKNMTIKNGESEDGGSIKNDGTLIITQSTITKSSTSTLVGLGGAIYNNYTGKTSITQSTFTGNSALDEVSYGAGGAIKNNGILNITQSTITKGIAHTGGAVDNYGTLTITNSTLANNRAKYQGGAIYCGPVKSKIIGSNFTNNRAQEGGAIFSNGNSNLTGNIFTDNTATNNKETIDLHGYWNGIFDNNKYKSTSISLKTINLKLKENRNTFYTGEDVELNLNMALNHTKYYDNDILKRLDDITIYINGKKTVTTKYQNYTLSN